MCTWSGSVYLIRFSVPDQECIWYVTLFWPRHCAHVASAVFIARHIPWLIRYSVPEILHYSAKPTVPGISWLLYLAQSLHMIRNTDVCGNKGAWELPLHIKASAPAITQYTWYSRLWHCYLVISHICIPGNFGGSLSQIYLFHHIVLHTISHT